MLQLTTADSYQEYKVTHNTSKIDYNKQILQSAL